MAIDGSSTEADKPNPSEAKRPGLSLKMRFASVIAAAAVSGGAGGMLAGKLGLIDVKGANGQVTGSVVVETGGMPSADAPIAIDKVEPVNIADAGITKEILDKEFKDIPSTKVFLKSPDSNTWVANNAEIDSYTLRILTSKKSDGTSSHRNSRAVLIDGNGNQYPVSQVFNQRARDVSPPPRTSTPTENNEFLTVYFNEPPGISRDELINSAGSAGLRLFLQTLDPEGQVIPGSSRQFEFVPTPPAVKSPQS